jgi:RecA/RadA recombinase
MARRKNTIDEDIESSDEGNVLDTEHTKSATSVLSGIYSSVFDEIANRFGNEDGIASSMEPMSTGMLAFDIILGGGLRPAWYTNLGGEQSAKTTSTITMMAAALKGNVPIVQYFDFEGSTASSLTYVSNILKSSGVELTVEEVFGVRDPDSGKYITKPRVTYSAESVGEVFFDRLHALLKALPDKRKLGRDWWLVFEDTKENKTKYGEQSDETMPRKYGSGIYIKAPDSKLQAVVITDSYPAMNPSSNDEEESDNSLALQARMFSKHLPRVKGMLARKMVAVVGVNQLRTNPMARFGPPETEPCGQALKFFSDARIKHTSRALSGVPTKPTPKENPDDKSTELESSVQYDGDDLYRYISLRAEKNKLWIPKRVAWARVWIEDASGAAQGLDPFYDTYWYLYNTGQVSGNKRNALKLTLHGFDEISINYFDIKLWVLGIFEQKSALCAKLGLPELDLRAHCFEQMRTGLGEKLYKAYTKGQVDTSEDD